METGSILSLAQGGQSKGILASQKGRNLSSGSKSSALVPLIYVFFLITF
jgi:hypothetical protein